MVPPKKLRAKKTIHLVIFSTSSRLNGEYLRKKHDIDNRARNSGNYKESPLHHLEPSWTLTHKRLKMGPSFLPTLRKFYILLHSRLRTRRSGNRTQPNFATCWEVNRICKCILKIWGVRPHNWGAKTPYFVTVLMSTKLYQKPKNREGGFTHLPYTLDVITCQRNKVVLHGECKWNHRSFRCPDDPKIFSSHGVASGGLTWQYVVNLSPFLVYYY